MKASCIPAPSQQRGWRKTDYSQAATSLSWLDASPIHPFLLLLLPLAHNPQNIADLSPAGSGGSSGLRLRSRCEVLYAWRRGSEANSGWWGSSLQPILGYLCPSGIESVAIQGSLEGQRRGECTLGVRKESPSHLRGWKGGPKAYFYVYRRLLWAACLWTR